MKYTKEDMEIMQQEAYIKGVNDALLGLIVLVLLVGFIILVSYIVL